MHSTFLAVGTPFFVIGAVFAASGDGAMGTTFLVLGIAFVTLGLATDRDGTDPPDSSGGPDRSSESDARV